MGDIFSNMMDDRKRSKEIKAKMNKAELRAQGIEGKIKKSEDGKEISAKAAKLKNKYGLSDKDAIFMAQRDVKGSGGFGLSAGDEKFMAERKQKSDKRSKAIHNVSSALGSAVNTIALEADVHPTKQKGKGNKRGGGQNNYDPLDSVLGGLGFGEEPMRPPSRKTVDNAKKTNKGKGGKKKKGKSKPKESKNNTSDPLGMPEFDIPGFKF